MDVGSIAGGGSGGVCVVAEHALMLILSRRANAGRGEPVMPTEDYAADKYIGQRELTPMGITSCQLSYEIHLAR